MNFRPILFIIGVLVSLLSLSMILPILIDLYRSNPDWKVFFLCMMLGLFFGGALLLNTLGSDTILSRRQTFVLIVTGWLSAALVGTLPFMFSTLNLSFSQAFFESVSSLTTTASSVISNIEEAPPGILIWRALLQWLGGLGTILMAISIMPFLKIGGMQLFRSDQGYKEKVVSRTAHLMISITLIYLVLTLLCILSYRLGGMTRFDAFAHALTTISTGGLSTREHSFGYFENPELRILAIIFMILGSLPFILLLKGLKGDFKSLISDSQVKAFFAILVLSSFIVSSYLLIIHTLPAQEAFLNGTFQTVSLITGTGFTSQNYNLWNDFILMLFLFLIAVGGCAGSTSGAIKIFRLQIFATVIRQQIQKLFYPHSVFISRYNSIPLQNDVPLSVLGFLFLYALCFTLLALALSLTGLDVMTSISGALSALSNTGPGMGDFIGPMGSHANLPESAHWILCIGMLLGRMEIIAVLILFQPLFWKN